MKIKANKILAVLCVVAMVMTMIVPMTLTASAAEPELVATFDFGANGSAAHVDGNSLGASKSYTNGSYTLSLTGMSSVYGPAYDAKGNSAIKLGTSSKTGTFTFSVPEEVTSVIIYAAKYKSNTSKITVNGATYTLSGASNSGAYDAITVDTTNTKSVTFATVSGGVRCMVNTIEFYAAADDSGCEHIWGEGEITTAPGCTTSGVRTFTCSVCSDTTTEPVAATGHTYVDGTCACGEIQPDTTLTIEQAIELGSKKAHDTYTDGKYYVAGVITEIYNTSYGNMYITDGENTLTVYGTYSADGKTRFDAMETQPVVGDTVIIYGIVGQYNGNAQIKNGWIMEIIQDEGSADIREALDAVNAYMSVAYKYVETTEMVEGTTTVTDTLTRATTGVTTGTAYVAWSDKSVTSSAVYAGKTAPGNESIQLRSNGNDCGVITTVSGGNARKISVTWNDATSAGRTLNVYGSNTAYSSAADLYDDSTAGTLLGTIVCGTSTELEIDGDYQYIAFRSAGSAMYLSEVQIDWETGSNAREAQEVTKLVDSQFVLKCGVDAGLAAIEGVDAYGIAITAGGKTVYYTSEAASWVAGDEVISVAIGLGDIINDKAKLSTEFTVAAFVEVEGIKYTSELDKTYSVASMIDEYDTMGIEEVAHLYNVLVGYGLI